MARPRFIALLLVLITVLVYLPVCHYGFLVYDDNDYVTENPMVQMGLSWAGVKWAFTTWHASNWHPLTWMSHMLDAQWFGPDAGAQHFINVLFHAANVLLLFRLLLRMTGKLWPCALVAALFAWHPLHVESVAWISERKDVLSTFFGLLAMGRYVDYAGEGSGVGGRGEEGKDFAAVRSYSLALFFFALSLMAKPMLVTLPFVLLLLDVWPLGRVEGRGSRGRWGSEPFLDTRLSTPRGLVLEKLPFLFLTVGSCIITFLAQRGEAVASLGRHPLGLRFANALVAYGRYLWKTIWPVNLAVPYPLPDSLPVWQIVLAALTLLAISIFAWRFRSRRPFLLVGWLWFLGTLVPVIGLVQVGGQALADRYTYVPLIGIFLAVVFGLSDWARGFQPRAAIIGTAVAALAATVLMTTRQLHFWRDSESLFTHATAVTKNNAIAQVNLGVALEQKGRPEEALAAYREALRVDPGYAQAHNNLANLLATLGYQNEALAEYREALRLKPNAPLAHANLGTLLTEFGQFEEAMREYRTASSLDPGDARPHYLMGKAAWRQGLGTQAVNYFREALQLDPDNFQTLTWLARALASDPDPAVRNGKKAVALAERANELTAGQEPFVLETMAMACAEMGRFKEARDVQQKAIERAAESDAKENLAAMNERLKLYVSEQPYRESRTNSSTPSNQ